MFQNVFRRVLVPSTAILCCGVATGYWQAVQDLSSPLPDKPALGPKTVVAKLIEQLSSSDFVSREAATKSLIGIGVPALDALCEATKATDLEVAKRASRIVETIKTSLEYLLVRYRHYGLPLPPPDSKLVRSGEQLGFFLGPDGLSKRSRLLIGTQISTVDRCHIIETADGIKDALTNFNPLWTGRCGFELNAGLALSLQCKSRGWDAIASVLWQRSVNQGCGFAFPVFRQAPVASGEIGVAQLAWAHYGYQLLQPASDLALIHRQLQRILLAHSSLDCKEKRELLNSIRSAVVVPKAARGSDEALIDDLIELSETAHRNDSTDVRFSKLVHRGFAAVPTLIQHLDDDRITRSVSGAFHNFPAWNQRIKHQVSYFLQELAGEDLGLDAVERRLARVVEKGNASEWWVRAQAVGEEEYVVLHVLPDKTLNSEWPRWVMLEIVSHRYPKRLPPLYMKLLTERAELHSWSLTEAIRRSSLPFGTKMVTLLYGMSHNEMKHRRPAYAEIRTLIRDELQPWLSNQHNKEFLKAWWSFNRVWMNWLARIVVAQHAFEELLWRNRGGDSLGAGT